MRFSESEPQSSLLGHIDAAQFLQPVILLQRGLELARVNAKRDLLGPAVPAFADHNSMQNAQHIQLGNQVCYAAMGQIVGLDQRAELFIHIVDGTGSDVSGALLFEKDNAVEHQLGLSGQSLMTSSTLSCSIFSRAERMILATITERALSANSPDMRRRSKAFRASPCSCAAKAAHKGMTLS